MYKITPSSDETLVYSSLTIAKEFNKRHNDVVTSIRNFINRHPEHNKEFFATTYSIENAGKLLKNRKYPCFLLTEKGQTLLKLKYKYTVHSASLERAFGEWLTIFFPGERIEAQYPVLGYRVDYFMPDLGICIEYDEKHHDYSSSRDDERQTAIQEELRRDYLENIEYDIVVERKPASESFPFIRVKQGKEVEGMRDLLILIRDKTMNDVVDYMLPSSEGGDFHG